MERNIIMKENKYDNDIFLKSTARWSVLKKDCPEQESGRQQGAAA